MNCEELRSLLDPWVDGELDEPTARALESHAASCPECARRLQFGRRLKELVALKARSPEPPAYLAERVRRAIGVQAGERRRQWSVAAPAAAIVVAAGLLAWAVLRGGGPGETLARALAEDHVKYLARSDAAQVKADEKGPIEDWFRGRLPFDLRLPGLDAKPVGARSCRILERPCGLVLYEKGACRLSLFVFEGGAFAQFPILIRVRGFTVAGWGDSGLSYALVSDLPPEEMERLRSGR